MTMGKERLKDRQKVHAFTQSILGGFRDLDPQIKYICRKRSDKTRKVDSHVENVLDTLPSSLCLWGDHTCLMFSPLDDG